MEKKIVIVSDRKQSIGENGKSLVSISPGVISGRFVCIFGQPPLDHTTGNLVSGDIQAQIRRVMDNVKAVLDAAGTTRSKVVKIVFLYQLWSL